MKSLAKNAICAVYKFSGAMHAQERLAYWAGRRFLSVLLFHRVTDAIAPDGLTVGTGWFKDFCRLMRDRFHVVSLAEAQRLLQSGIKLPRRVVAITFDDCYRDNLDAARVLSDHGLPATFFVPTKFIGTDHAFYWDRHLSAPMPNLSWDDLKAMVRLGHDIGSHSVSHPDFGQIGVEQARYELLESKRVLESELQRPARMFAYPFGGRSNFKPEYLQLVQSAGYDACFSGVNGFVEPRHLGTVLPRVPMPFFRSLNNLELHLTGCLDWFYRFKRQVGLVT